MLTQIHICTHTHARMHTYMHIHAYTCTYMLKRSFYCILEFLFVCVLHRHASTCSHACTHMLVCTHACKYAHIHVHTCIYVHIHAQTFILSCAMIFLSAHCTHTSTCPLTQHMHSHTDMESIYKQFDWIVTQKIQDTMLEDECDTSHSDNAPEIYQEHSHTQSSLFRSNRHPNQDFGENCF